MHRAPLLGLLPPCPALACALGPPRSLSGAPSCSSLTASQAGGVLGRPLSQRQTAALHRAAPHRVRRRLCRTSTSCSSCDLFAGPALERRLVAASARARLGAGGISGAHAAGVSAITGVSSIPCRILWLTRAWEPRLRCPAPHGPGLGADLRPPWPRDLALPDLGLR
ncbi:unnamed protein product [Prorocentrum cordatum]|uniref:Secreted protein n=1 Tax=Prorocentrum cordatum TaxID=2364126 RepID=A0ABN9VZU1_9DINO|nr:unnamed protein product [Polarella glacialis]